jgi:dienelactone hydrolase
MGSAQGGASLKEFPVFIPTGDHRLAGVMTIPDDDPAGVVLLTTGGGSTPRSQRFGLWTRAARRLADRGVASLRIEWAGVGDSTGTAIMGFDHLPVDDAVAAARFAMAAAGTHRLGIAGNCGGARTVLLAVRQLPECESMVLFFLKPLARARRSPTAVRRAASIARLLPQPLRRLAKRAWVRLQSRSGGVDLVAEALLQIGPRVDLLLLENKEMGDLPQYAAALAQMPQTGRLEMRQLESTTLRAFEHPEDQEFAIESVVDWFTDSFRGATDDGGVSVTTVTG